MLKVALPKVTVLWTRCVKVRTNCAGGIYGGQNDRPIKGSS